MEALLCLTSAVEHDDSSSVGGGMEALLCLTSAVEHDDSSSVGGGMEALLCLSVSHQTLSLIHI